MFTKSKAVLSEGVRQGEAHVDVDVSININIKQLVCVSTQSSSFPSKRGNTKKAISVVEVNTVSDTPDVVSIHVNRDNYHMRRV